MSRIAVVLATLTLATLSSCSDQTLPRSADATAVAAEDGKTAAQASIEARIYPAVTIEGEAQQTLLERMAHFNAPQLSVAVWRDGKLDWAQGYGEGSDAQTLFQAASLSKAVAATGIVALAVEQGVSLDEDISGSLDGIDMTTLNPEGVAITLRGLLSHTNGATVGGFAGYADGEAVPSNLAVVNGTDGANNDPVTIGANPDGDFSYSGGGYQLAQLWAEQASGEDFASLMDRLILAPAGMTKSTFAQPLPAELASGNVAPAYDGNGDAVPGRWHIYPEQAAAGLWTTPSDYGRFVTALMGAMTGDAETGISPDVAAEVTQAVSEGYGLGIGVETKDGETVLRHSGSNRGYKTYFEAWPDRGDAIVVMTGTESAFPLNADVVRTAKQAYGWPMGPLQTRSRVSLEESALLAFEGSYGRSGEAEALFTIEATPPNIQLTTRRGARYTLVPIGEAAFIDPDDAQEARFEMDGETMTVTTGGTVFERLAENP